MRRVYGLGRAPARALLAVVRVLDRLADLRLEADADAERLDAADARELEPRGRGCFLVVKGEDPYVTPHYY